MKTNRILIVLLPAIVVAVLLHYQDKRKAIDNIDQLQRALLSAKPYITPGSRIGFTGESENGDIFSKTRFVLAPDVNIYEATETTDTLLSIKYNVTDTTALKRRLIWETRDAIYHYTLTATP